MIPSHTLENPESKVTFDLTQEKKDALIERLLRFYVTHWAWSGESIMQRDEPSIMAAPLLADIVDDIIEPTVTWK